MRAVFTAVLITVFGNAARNPSETHARTYLEQVEVSADAVPTRMLPSSSEVLDESFILDPSHDRHSAVALQVAENISAPRKSPRLRPNTLQHMADSARLSATQRMSYRPQSEATYWHYKPLNGKPLRVRVDHDINSLRYADFDISSGSLVKVERVWENKAQHIKYLKLDCAETCWIPDKNLEGETLCFREEDEPVECKKDPKRLNIVFCKPGPSAAFKAATASSRRGQTGYQDTAGTYKMGDRVEYWSESHKEWINAGVIEVNAARHVKLDVKPNQWLDITVQREKVRRMSDKATTPDGADAPRSSSSKPPRGGDARADPRSSERSGQEPKQMLKEGAQVMMYGLSAANSHLNGIAGICERWDPGKGRWSVKLRNGDIKEVKLDNLAIAHSGKMVRPGNSVVTIGLPPGDNLMRATVEKGVTWDDHIGHHNGFLVRLLGSGDQRRAIKVEPAKLLMSAQQKPSNANAGQQRPSNAKAGADVKLVSEAAPVRSRELKALKAKAEKTLTEKAGNLEERKRIFRDLQRDFHPDKAKQHSWDEQEAKDTFQWLMGRRQAYLT